MEMHQIRYFVAVCEKRNFTEAAPFTIVTSIIERLSSNRRSIMEVTIVIIRCFVKYFLVIH